MYEQFFGLAEKPFSIQPDPSFLYWGRTHRLAYAMLEYGVLNHAGISVITGEVGCGKTTLIHRLLDQLADSHTVALLSNVQAGRGDLLSWVLMAFGQPFGDQSHVALFSQLQSFFISEYAKGRRIVLIIDEAQNLSMDMLEELRLLSNINAGKDQLLQLILVGQPQLKDVLNRPELLQLTQRVGSDFHLTPLSREEVHAYVETRLSIAGCRRRIFTERAIDMIAEQSRGVPRVINVIADTALVYAFSAEDLVVGVETVRNVVRDKKAYGVFGIASSDNAAAPLAASPDDMPDDLSFSTGEELLPTQRSGSDYEDDDACDDVAPHTPIKTMTDLRAQPRPQYAHEAAMARDDEPVHFDEPAEEKPFAPATHAALTALADDPLPAPSREPTGDERPVTGVVVYSSDPRASPEAAIRSVGDGRAVVFSPAMQMADPIAAARRAGAVIVDPPAKGALTGGRARNAGYRQLKKIAPRLRYVQFVDASGALDPDWIDMAEKFMERRPEVAVIEGRAQLQSGANAPFPTLAEQRKNETPGEVVRLSGPSAFVRADAFETSGGFRGDLLSCELDDLCIRQRKRGAHIWRVDSNMMICEQPRRNLSAWWRRAVRRGFDHAYAASLHGGPPDRIGVPEMARAVVWGGVVPLLIVVAAGAGALIANEAAPMTPAKLVGAGVLAAGAAIYLLKVVASAARRGLFSFSAWARGFGAVFGRFGEFRGVIRFWLGGSKPV